MCFHGPEEGDSNTVSSQARLNNFEHDLGLEGTDFNVAVSILNVGYVLSSEGL
jgi:hypothetical protein